ncbi:MAG TPA: gluconokinase [Streptosporangiaceae bacterium]|nr:gluconokinase [Streptosporangiaceae bacterium]
MIVVVAGVAGSGKSTVGQLLAQRLGWQFEDGDSLHPAANIAKMRAGHPLTDADRQPWLAAMRSWMDDVHASGRSGVLACSALRRNFREQLLGGRDDAVMVFLTITEQQCQDRLRTRRGHFFGAPLLASQFALLEPPDPAERQVHEVATDDGPPGELVTKIIKLLGVAPSAGQPAT